MFELGEQLGRPLVEVGLSLSHQQPDAAILLTFSSGAMAMRVSLSRRVYQTSSNQRRL